MRKALGIRHIALRVKNFKECLNFYTNILGMKIDWQPDEKNVYLTINKKESRNLRSGYKRTIRWEGP